MSATFPSMCFALATGVGKTRLMGAFVAYLYLEKGIKNFFVLAPNLTIYNKLIGDFENVSSPKYVFQGIGEFVHSRPRIVTGDNYDQYLKWQCLNQKSYQCFQHLQNQLRNTRRQASTYQAACGVSWRVVFQLSLQSR